MKRSSLTAPMRIYDTGHDRVAVYYLDVFEEQQLVGFWKRSEVATLIAQFAETHGFEAFALQIVPVQANAAS
jgi:hypothetical protein